MPGLVSCIMATRNRPRFFQQALRCFAAQSYPNCELIVVDDGDEPVGEYCHGRERVRYLRMDGPTSTGMKLNIGIEHARGDILQKLDDDDYYHPDFLSLAVEHFPVEDRAAAIVAWDCFLVLFAGEEQLHFSGYGWTAGGTFCFSRELWRKHGFRDLACGSDGGFLLDHQPRVVAVEAPEHYLLVRHGRHTWTEMEHGETADDYLRRQPLYSKPLAALVDAPALAFYRSLRRSAGP